MPGDSRRNLLGFNASSMYEQDNLSPIAVDILSFDNFFLETNIAQGMILKGNEVD